VLGVKCPIPVSSALLAVLAQAVARDPGLTKVVDHKQRFLVLWGRGEVNCVSVGAQSSNITILFPWPLAYAQLLPPPSLALH